MRAIAFDTETKGFDWWNPEQQAFLATWATADSQSYADLSDPAQVGRFGAAIQGLRRGDVIIGHNVKFDIHQVRETIGFDILAFAEANGIEIWDTDIMSRILHPEGQNKTRAGHSLKNLATIYLRADAQGAEEHIAEMAKSLGHRTLKKDGVYYDVYRAYPDAMIRYALDDARFTYDLWDRFMRELANADEGTQRIMELERKVTPILIRGEARGVATDQEAVAKFKRQFVAQEHELHDALVKELGDEAIDGDDKGQGMNNALVEALLAIGVPLTELTESGDALSTSKKALNEHRFDFPIIETLFEYRRVKRFLSTYLGPMEGQDVLHASFMQCEAWTGRMSCRRPNMQNWPKRAGKEVRSVLVPREGYVFLVSDYEGIEERLGAYYLGDAGYRELVAHYDPHAWMAAQIWGGEPEQYGKESDKAVSHRQPAKNIKYALWYGAGAKRVRFMLMDAGLPATFQDAKSMVSKIKSSMPNYYHLMDRIKAKIAAVGHVTTIYGRRNPVDKRKSYVGMSALIQGSAADILKIALVAADEAVRPLGGTVLMTVHDEILVEIKPDRAEKGMAALETAMLSAWDLNPPLSVEGGIVATNYAEA